MVRNMNNSYFRRRTIVAGLILIFILLLMHIDPVATDTESKVTFGVS
jgi:hypothetical protein